MGTPHKHAALIKAWADGALIQYKDGYGTWVIDQERARIAALSAAMPRKERA